MLSLRDFLVRGLIAGVIAGFAAFVVSYAIGEPPIESSIAIEEAADAHDHGAVAEEEEEEEGAEVSREMQSTAGLLTGMVFVGAALGGLAGIATGLAMGRFFSRTDVRVTALSVAGVAFVTVYFVPYLIYPPNPPAVGDGDTIGYRTGLYFVMLAISLGGLAVSLAVNHNLRDRIGHWYAALAGVATYLVIAVLALSFMPRYDEVPTEGFPPSLLWDFRLSSLLVQIVLWVVLGLVLAELSQRALRAKAAPTKQPVNA